MTRDEVLRKITEARKAIEQYKREKLNETITAYDRQKVTDIERETKLLLVEARSLGAAGRPCPQCGGSGRI